MKAVTYDINGEPWEVVTVSELPDPVPGPGEVLIALEAAPIHIADLIAIRGDKEFFPIEPGVPGFEGVGRVVSCASDVDDWREGDRVFLPIGYGAWKALHALHASQLMRAPEGVAAEQLALVPINLATAYLNLFAYEKLVPGDWIVQNAANSNVATYTAAIAQSKGIRVINIVRRAQLVGPLKASGRAHVLVDGPTLAHDIAAITAVKPRLALDAVGGAATARLGNCVADQGLVLSYGFLSKQPHQIDYPDLMFRGVRLRGMMTNWAYERLSEDELKAMRAHLEQMTTSDQLKANIAGIYPFAQVADALRHAAQTGAQRTGKVILVPG